MKKLLSTVLAAALTLLAAPTAVWADEQLPNISVDQVIAGNAFPTSDVSFILNTDAAKVQYKAYDYWDNIVASGVQDITSSTQQLDFTMTKKGVFRLELLAINAEGVTKTETSFSVLDPLPATDIPLDTPFVMQTHMAKNNMMRPTWHNVDKILDFTQLNGFRMVRNTVRWLDFEKQKGVYTFSDDHRKMFDEVRARNMKIYFVAAEYNPSFYANWTEEFYTGFTNYVDAILTEYSDVIGWVEVLNEPNTNHGPTLPDGTVLYPDTEAQGAEYAKLMHKVYTTLKPKYQDIEFVAGATCDNGRTFFKGMFDSDADGDTKADGAKFCDAISFHMYELNPVSASGQYDLTAALLGNYLNSNVPIYLSETGRSPVPNGADVVEANDMGENIRRQAVFMAIQMVDAVKSFKNGGGLVNLYQLFVDSDTTIPANLANGEHNFGIVRAVEDPRGAYTPRWAVGTVSTMTRMLNNYNFTNYTEYATDMRSYLFKNGTAETRFMFSAYGKYTLSATATGPVEVFDMMGNSIYTGEAGAVSFDVDNCPVYVKGVLTNITAAVSADNQIFQAESLTPSRDNTNTGIAGQAYFSDRGRTLSVDNKEVAGGTATFTLNVAKAGNYRLVLRQARKPDRGIWNIKLDSTDLGDLDCTVASGTYVAESDLGVHNLTQGNHTLTFTFVVGEGSSIFLDMFALEQVADLGLEINTPPTIMEGGAPQLLTTNVPKANVQWSGSDDTIAKVIDGWIFPIRAGSVDVTASYGHESVSRSITISAQGEGYEITLLEKSIDLSDERELPAVEMSPEGDEITWQSSDPNIVAVEDGKLKAKRIGNVTLTAYYGNDSDSCEINVIAAKYPITKDAFTHINDGKQVDETNNTDLLYVRNAGNQYRTTFIGADLPGLEGVNVQKAELFLFYLTFTGGNQYIEYGGGLFPLYHYDEPWDEVGDNAVTYNNSNGANVTGLTKVGELDIPADPVANTPPPHETMDKFYSVDLTEYVNNSVDKKVSLKMLGDSGKRAKNGGRYQFASKENSNVERIPYIWVEVKPPVPTVEFAISVEFADKDGVTDDKLTPEGSVAATATIPMEMVADKDNITFILAIYDDDTLVDLAFVPHSLDPEDNNYLSASIETLPDIDMTNCRYSVFLWDNELRPLETDS